MDRSLRHSNDSWLRFVVLRHETPAESLRPSHWDVMLEWGEALRTWAVEQLPWQSDALVAAELLPDHRLEYLNYEGPVSRNRGSVARAEWGSYQIAADCEGLLRVELRGQLIQGELRIHTPPSALEARAERRRDEMSWLAATLATED